LYFEINFGLKLHLQMLESHLYNIMVLLVKLGYGNKKKELLLTRRATA